MAQHPKVNDVDGVGGPRGEMAQALQELARGEQTASQLERKLDGIENKLDELLRELETNASSSLSPEKLAELQQQMQALEKGSEEARAEVDSAKAAEQESSDHVEPETADKLGSSAT